MPLKWTWIPLLLHSLEFFCCFGDVGDHYGCFVIAAVVWVAAGVVVGVGSWCLLGMVEFVFPLV